MQSAACRGLRACVRGASAACRGFARAGGGQSATCRGLRACVRGAERSDADGCAQAGGEQSAACKGCARACVRQSTACRGLHGRAWCKRSVLRSARGRAPGRPARRPRPKRPGMRRAPCMTKAACPGRRHPAAWIPGLPGCVGSIKGPAKHSRLKAVLGLTYGGPHAYSVWFIAAGIFWKRSVLWCPARAAGGAGGGGGGGRADGGKGLRLLAPTRWRRRWCRRGEDPVCQAERDDRDAGAGAVQRAGVRTSAGCCRCPRCR